MESKSFALALSAGTMPNIRSSITPSAKKLDSRCLYGIVEDNVDVDMVQICFFFSICRTGLSTTFLLWVSVLPVKPEPRNLTPVCSATRKSNGAAVYGTGRKRTERGPI